MVKKGQMKMQQTAFLLIAITLLFILVGIFALRIYLSSISSTKDLLNEENAIKEAARLASSPELTCGNAFSTNWGSCVDFDKAMVLKENIDSFESLWDVTGIEIRKIYPSSTEICTKENYPNCGILEVLPKLGGNNKPAFISLCRKEVGDFGVYDKCELAVLIVEFSGGEK